MQRLQRAPPPCAGCYSSKIARLGHSIWPAPGTILDRAGELTTRTNQYMIHNSGTQVTPVATEEDGSASPCGSVFCDVAAMVLEFKLPLPALRVQRGGEVITSGLVKGD